MKQRVSFKKYFGTEILERGARYFYLGYPVHKFLELLKIRNSVHAGNVLSAYYALKTFKMGLWRHGLVIAEK